MKLKVKNKELDVTDETYALVDALKDLTHAIKRWKRG